jgi:hypothetical protein
MLYISLTRCIAFTFALAATVSVAAAPATAADAAVVHVAGLLAADTAGVCTEHMNTPVPPSVVSGSLSGCWYVDTLDVRHATPSGAFVATGSETFSGCLDTACGHLFATYTFTAKFAADGSEVHGRCHHPIVGGDGGLAGVTGEINMHDLPNGCAVYKGSLKLAGQS